MICKEYFCRFLATGGIQVLIVWTGKKCHILSAAAKNNFGVTIKTYVNHADADIFYAWYVGCIRVGYRCGRVILCVHTWRSE